MVRPPAALVSRLVFTLPLLAYVAVYFVDGTAFHPSGDGYYSWLFARSLAFDGDLDFKNDYALCGDPFSLAVDRGTGHADNPYYAGPAVFWVPPLAVLRGLWALLLGSARAAHASCGGWMTALTLLVGPLCGALSVWLAFRAASLIVRPSVAAWTALLFAFTSPLFPYSTSVAHYSHVYLTLAVAVMTFVSLRAVVAGPARWDGVSGGAAMAVAVLCRSSAALYAVVPATALVSMRMEGRPLPWRMVTGAALGTAVGAGLTGALYTYLYGRWLVIPQGADYMHFDRAHPLLLLFGVHGGFFFWMPAAWLAVAGLAWGARSERLRAWTLGCLAAAVAEIVVSSAALDWDARWTLGARRLLPLTPLVILFASLAVDRGLGLRPVARAVGLSPVAPRRAAMARWVAAAAIALTLVNNIPASTTIRGDENFSQAELYGAWSPLRPLWRLLDRAGVDVALLPAEAYFVARYRLPPSSYRDAMTPRYSRSFRTLVREDPAFDMGAPWVGRVTRGARWSEHGLALGDGEAHFVFAAEWPFATHVGLLLESDGPATVDLSSRSPLGGMHTMGRASVAGPGVAWAEVAVPEGAFDSGMNEWVLRARGAKVTVRTVAIDDRTPRVPHG
ncbi:MAG TPA: hypothetical protein VGM06_00735 [Polyangiaceae bacterium]|jgi:hypothetical protein